MKSNKGVKSNKGARTEWHLIGVLATSINIVAAHELSHRLIGGHPMNGNYNHPLNQGIMHREAFASHKNGQPIGLDLDCSREQLIRIQSTIMSQ